MTNIFQIASFENVHTFAVHRIRIWMKRFVLRSPDNIMSLNIFAIIVVVVHLWTHAIQPNHLTAAKMVVRIFRHRILQSGVNYTLVIMRERGRGTSRTSHGIACVLACVSACLFQPYYLRVCRTHTHIISCVIFCTSIYSLSNRLHRDLTKSLCCRIDLWLFVCRFICHLCQVAVHVFIQYYFSFLIITVAKKELSASTCQLTEFVCSFLNNAVGVSY